MPPAPSTAAPRARPGRRPATALAVLAAWAVAVPWVARALGLTLDVPTRLEIVDHVIPGCVVLVCAGALLHRRAGGPPGSVRRLIVIGVAALAGLWITTTHVPLLSEAVDGITGWGPALMHLSAGLPVLAVALAMLLTEAGR